MEKQATRQDRKESAEKELLQGLTEREVAERRESEKRETRQGQITKSKWQIVSENLFTLFNFLNFLIAGLLFAVGAYSNMLFIGIIILNIMIGITQELKAKKLVDELSILNCPRVRVHFGTNRIMSNLQAM